MSISAAAFIRSSRRAFTAGLAGLAVLLGCGNLLGADPGPAPSSVVTIPLARAKNKKLFLHATTAGGLAWMLIDIGAPLSCADETKTALFRFKPFSKGARSPKVISNGVHESMLLVPQIDFGGSISKDFAVVLINIAHMNQAQRLNRDIPYDGILGLGDLRRMHAVIDCGAGTLSLGSHTPREKAPEGWISIPMSLLDDHLIVPGAVNGIATHFCVDTGSPESALDVALCRRLRIPAALARGTVEALGVTQSPHIANIADMKIGPRDMGKGEFVAFDISKLVGPQQRSIGVSGFIGSETLQNLKAIIDCDAMQLYIK